MAKDKKDEKYKGAKRLITIEGNSIRALMELSKLRTDHSKIVVLLEELISGIDELRGEK